MIGGGLIGAYLHGSAVLGGLQAQSDIDVLAVIERSLTAPERRRMVAHLLVVSGRYPSATPPRPLELTIAVRSDIHPWRYPPRVDFQYGEWWRDPYVRGELDPRSSKIDPDLALIVTMALLGAAPLVGPPPSEVFEPIPTEDVLQAMAAGIQHLVADVDDDTRNVVLTLARIWSGVVSGAILSKEAAAGWALPRLEPEHRAVLTYGPATRTWASRMSTGRIFRTASIRSRPRSSRRSRQRDHSDQRVTTPDGSPEG